MKWIKKKNNQGFTLIELLAVISVLSLIVTVVIYVSLNVIDNAKENSYQVTINNVIGDVNSYVLENKDNRDWNTVSMTDYEYQCVTVQNLIDSGYLGGDVLSSNVSEGVNLKSSDYIYLERDRKNYAITKKVLLVGDYLDVYSDRCALLETEGEISLVVNPSGWAKKKSGVITYKIINNYESIGNFKYSYEFKSSSGNNNKSGSGSFNNKIMMVNTSDFVENGTLLTSIINKNGDILVTHSWYISGIDKTGPEITFGTNGNSLWEKSVSSVITVTDSQSGVDKGTLKYIYSTDKNVNPTKDFVSGEVYGISSVDGKYYLIVSACDNVGNCSIKVSNQFKLDNTPPIVTCDKDSAYAYQVRDSDKSRRDLELYNVSECSVSADMYYVAGGIYTGCYELFDYSDNNKVASSKCNGVIYNEKGVIVDNLRYSKGNCKSGYCNYIKTVKVCDQAGNCSDKEFTYKLITDRSLSW